MKTAPPFVCLQPLLVCRLYCPVLAWPYLVDGGHCGVEGGAVLHAVRPERVGAELAAGRKDDSSTRRQRRQEACEGQEGGPSGRRVSPTRRRLYICR